MALDKLVDSTQLDADLTSVADAIREKGGTSAVLSFPTEFVSAIENIETGTDVSDTTTVAGDVRSGKYFYTAAGVKTEGTVPDTTFANSATAGKTYTDKSSTAPVLVSGDYLYVNKGYTEDIKISLARLVPDGSDVKGHSEYIVSGHSAYDNEGTLVAGSIPTLAATDVTVNGRTVTIPTQKYTGASGDTAVTKSIGVGTVTSGTASITSITKTYNSTNDNFDISGSADVSAPSVGTAGYISSSEGTRNKNTGGASVTATIPKIMASTAFSGTTTKKPSITKQSTPTGVINAASGDATTTAPSSGVYVAVKSAANTGTITATPTVDTAGYGDATNNGITGNSTTVGAAASDTTYVPIATTSASVSGKTVSYGSGWITEGSKSVADGAYSASVNAHSVTTSPVVTGATSGTITDIGSTTKPSSGTDGTDYWTITPGGSVTTTGKSTASGKATIGTAGYLAAGNKTSSDSVINITPTVNNGTALYISKASSSISNGTASATGGTASTTVSGMVTSETDTGYSVSASATGGNASVTASSATVGVGYNPSSVTASTTAKNATGTSASQTKYIQKGALAAAVSSNSGGSASMAATGFTASSSATSYYVTLATSAGSVKAKATVGTEGYVKSETAETSATSVSVSGNGNKLYIPAGSVTTSFTGDGMSTYFNSGTSSDKNVTIVPKYTNTAGYKPAVTTATNNGGTAYYKIKTTSASVSGKTVSYGTGWITEGSKSVADGTLSQGTTTVSGTTATRGTASWTAGYQSAGSIAAATFTNEATSGKTYVDISNTTSAPVLVSGDYLYINKGYTDDLKISLARLVPDGSDVKGHGDYLLSGHSAYGNDGVLVAGTITTLAASDVAVSGRTLTIPLQKYTGASGATAVTKSIDVGTVTSGTASITSLTKTYNSTNGNFDITGSADVSAPSVGTAGYISSTEGTRNKKTGGATVSATIAKIAGSIAISGTKLYTPSITKQNTPSGVTNAASGNATTTAPSSGVYVAVKSAKNSGNVSAAATISTAGYGDSTNHGISGSGNVEVGANASATTYIPITTASPTFSAAPSGGSTASSSTASISNSTNNSGVSIQTAYSINAATISYAAAVNGWVSKSASASTGSSTTAKGSTNGTLYYINGVTLTAPSSGSRTFSVTVPNGSSTATFVFNVDASGNVTITES